MRVGLRYVRGLSDALLDRIDDERAEQPFADLEDFTRRTGAPTDARRGARHRRRVRQLRPHPPRGAVGGGRAARRPSRQAARAWSPALEAPTLPGMTEIEETAADLWATGSRAGRHPTEFVREPSSPPGGVVTAEALRDLPDRTVVEVGGHRHPPPAAGDGQGRGVPQPRGRDRPRERDLHARRVEAASARWRGWHRALVVRGLLERYQGVINVLARRIEALPLGLADLLRSRDFH